MRPVLILFLLMISFVSGAFAAPLKQDYTIAYGLYAGGFRALDITMRFENSDKTYGLTMKAKPFGVIGSLLPWAGNYTTTGTRSNAALIPSLHKKQSQWREDKDQDSFVYKKGILVSLKRIDGEKKPAIEQNIPLDPAMTKDAVDLLTGALYPIARINENKACTGKVTVFDGKRRYYLKFTEKREETLSKSEYNLFSGKALVCQIEMIPLAGFKGKKRGYYKIQEEGRAQGQLPKIWLGQLWEGGPYVPVRILLKSELGAILIHAQKVLR